MKPEILNCSLVYSEEFEAYVLNIQIKSVCGDKTNILNYAHLFCEHDVNLGRANGEIL